MRMGRTVAIVWQALHGLTAAGTVADLHGIPLAKAAAKVQDFLIWELSYGQEIFQNPNTESMILKDFEIDIHQILAKQSQNKEIPLESGTSCKATTQTNKRDSVPLAGRLSFL